MLLAGMQEMPAKVPSYSCRAGAPVVFISQQRTSIPAKLEISTREQGEENLYIVKVGSSACCGSLSKVAAGANSQLLDGHYWLMP